MFFRQVLHEDLGCASYVVADGGEAAVIDPKWDVEEYLELAAEHGFRVTHVLETHNHADHVSGRGRLRAATGATIHVSDAAGVEYEHEPMRDADAVTVGSVRIVAMKTPGHRPEHTSFLVEDATRSGEPWLVLTGDSLFVGDVARPDLAVDKDEGARGLFRSMHRLLQLDDFAEAWPGHIGGSMCGSAAMSEKPGTTIGFERRFNHLLRTRDEDDFVRELTGRVGRQPPNFRRIVALNTGPLLTEAVELEPLPPERVRELADAGAVLLDGRDTAEFDAAHVPGSINVTMVRSAVGTRAAWVTDPEGDVVLTAATDEDARHMGRLLEAVGFTSLRGLLAGGLGAWSEAGLETASIERTDIPGLAALLAADAVLLLDVREDDEWDVSHVPGSLHVPFHELADGIPDEVRASPKPVAAASSAGNRSAIAVSLLRRQGVDDVIHVVGNVAKLSAEGVELVSA
jgi:glyoxylase-like metal-dependent hydrolase (beta-lactamase superfamily II)/rhodanese-related sulfurtransferase